ncbi:MAG: inactive transglutaminase family protein [Pseudomonadota bacterium]
MHGRGPVIIMVILLFVLGFSAATFRHEMYNIPWLPSSQAQVWQVEARIEFTAQGGPSQVQLTLPPEQSGFEIVMESAASSGWGFSIEPGEQRRALWSQRDPDGRQILFYKLDIVTNNDQQSDEPPSRRSAVVWDEPYQTAVDHLLSTVYPTSADAHTLTLQVIQALGRVPVDQNLSLLISNYDRQDLLVRVLQTADVQARKVQVLVLDDGRRRQSLASYLQVWDGARWRLYDPNVGELTETENLLLWQTGTPAVLEVLGGTNSRVTFSMISQTRSSTVLAQEQADDLALSLYNLPIAEQGMFQLIMLLPVGAFVVTLLRVLIGVRTSGTFMPVLIALAFLQTELLPGLASFIIVVAIGLFIRSYLSSLNLLLVARIATLVVLVISIISIFSIVSFRLGLIQGLTITFFPMIILAWTIERMSITWEEEGPKEVFIQGGGSLFVAVLAYLLMSVDVVEHLAFHFPELHLVLLGLILLLGRYTGYRLLELRRFAAFRSEEDRLSS